MFLPVPEFKLRAFDERHAVQRVRVHRDAERPRHGEDGGVVQTVRPAEADAPLRAAGAGQPGRRDVRVKQGRLAFVAVAAGGGPSAFPAAPDAGRAVSRASRVPRPAPPAFQFPSVISGCSSLAQKVSIS